VGEQENLAPQTVRFLLEHRGSIDTIRHESETDTYLVACHETDIVGMVAAKRNEITKLYVDPSWHRNGIGRVLFKNAEEMIEEQRHSTLVLGAIGTSPVPFYQSLGMIVVGRKPCHMPQESGREVLLMEKPLVRHAKECHQE
jgi:predicted N-acetyltransferase YhbS